MARGKVIISPSISEYSMSVVSVCTLCMRKWPVASAHNAHE